VIHERLEREIHPEEILVVTETREDVWGLRYVSPLRSASDSEGERLICEVHHDVVGYAVFTGPGDV
jgi:hypothetical protein